MRWLRCCLFGLAAYRMLCGWFSMDDKIMKCTCLVNIRKEILVKDPWCQAHGDAGTSQSESWDPSAYGKPRIILGDVYRGKAND